MGCNTCNGLFNDNMIWIAIIIFFLLFCCCGCGNNNSCGC